MNAETLNFLVNAMLSRDNLVMLVVGGGLMLAFVKVLGLLAHR
jgi:hypothetical protein